MNLKIGLKSGGKPGPVNDIKRAETYFVPESEFWGARLLHR
jgi:hypothetical protein